MTNRNPPSEGKSFADDRDGDPARLLARGRMSRVIVRDDHRVFKRYHAGIAGSVATREATRIRLATSLGIRTPAVLAVHSDDLAPGLCLQRIHAPTLLEAMLRGSISPAAAGLRLAVAHVELLTTPLPANPPASLPGSFSALPRIDEPSEVDTRSDARSDLQERGARALCHFDFHPGNLLWDAHTDTTWIIDWHDAGWAVPSLDVAWTSLLLRFGEAPPDIAIPPAALQDLRRALHASYLTGVLSALPLSLPSLARATQTLAAAWPHRLDRDPATQAALARLAAVDNDNDLATALSQQASQSGNAAEAGTRA